MNKSHRLTIWHLHVLQLKVRRREMHNCKYFFKYLLTIGNAEENKGWSSHSPAVMQIIVVHERKSK